MRAAAIKKGREIWQWDYLAWGKESETGRGREKQGTNERRECSELAA